VKRIKYLNISPVRAQDLNQNTIVIWVFLRPYRAYIVAVFIFDGLHPSLIYYALSGLFNLKGYTLLWLFDPNLLVIAP
jgi:hypothetical protein